MNKSSVLQALKWIIMEGETGLDRHSETIHRKEIKSLKRDLNQKSEASDKSQIIESFLKEQLREFLNTSKQDHILKSDADIDLFINGIFDANTLRGMIAEGQTDEFEQKYNHFISSFIDIKINEVKESEYFQSLAQLRQELRSLKSDLYGGLQHNQSSLELNADSNLAQKQEELEQSGRKLNKTSTKLRKTESKQEKIIIQEVEKYTIEAYRHIGEFFEETLDQEYGKQQGEKRKIAKLRRRFIVQAIFDELKQNETASGTIKINLPESAELHLKNNTSVSIDLRNENIISALDSIIYLRQFDRALGETEAITIRDSDTRSNYERRKRRSEVYTEKYEESVNELTESRDRLYEEYISSIQITNTESLAILFADLDFDTHAEISPKQEDSQYRSGFARFLFDKNQNGIKESRYRKAFDGVPKNSSLESQIKHSYMDATSLYGQETVNQNIIDVLKTISGATLEGWDKTNLGDKLKKKESIGLLMDFRTFIMDNPIFIQRIFSEGSYGNNVAYEQAGDVIIAESNLDKTSQEFTVWYNGLAAQEKDKISNSLDAQIDQFFLTQSGKVSGGIPESISAPEGREQLRKALMFGGFQIMGGLTYQQSKDQLGLIDGKVQKIGTAEKGKLLFNALTVGSGCQLSIIEKDRFQLGAGLNLSASGFARTNENFEKEIAFNIGLSLGLDGVMGVGKKIGNTDITTGHIFFGVGVGAGIGGGANFGFGPYAYLGAEKIINVDKLTSTLDPTSSRYLGASTSVSLAGPTANVYFRKDRFEGLEITRDSIHTKYAEIFTRMLTNLKEKEVNGDTIKNEIISELIKKGSFDESKRSTIDHQANKILMMIRFYSPTNEIDDAEISVLSERLAYYYSLNRKNENSMLYENKIELSGVNIGIESLFGLSSIGLNKKTQAVMYDDQRSVEESKIALENNQGAQEIISTSGKTTIGSYTSQINSLIRNYVGGNAEYLTNNNNGTVTINKSIIGKVDIRLNNQYLQYIKQDTGGNLVIPDDIASGISTIMQSNSTKAVLAIGYQSNQALVEFTKWDGENGGSGIPEGYESRSGVSIEDMNASLQSLSIDNGASKPLSNFSFVYNNGILELNNNTGSIASIQNINDLTHSDVIITITKNSDGSYSMSTATNTTTGVIIKYQESTENINNLGEKKAIQFTEGADFKLNEAFESQFNEPSLLRRIIFNKPHSVTYNNFSKYMVEGSYNNASERANKLVRDLKSANLINTNHVFEGDNLQMQLLRFESLLIYSTACKCNLESESGPVVFAFRSQSGSSALGALMDFRTSFTTRSKANYPNTNSELINARNKSRTALLAENEYSFKTKKNSVGIIFGYPQESSVRNKLEEKLVYEPKYIEGSSISLALKGDNQNLELYESFNTKMSIIEGDNRLTQKLQEQVSGEQAKQEIASNINAIKENILKGSEYAGRLIHINHSFNFFLYPHCANEGVSLDLTVQEKPITTETKEAQTALNTKEGLPTGMYTNLLANANRVGIGQIQVGAGAKVNTFKPGSTLPRVEIDIDGKTIPIILPEGATLTQIPDGSWEITTRSGNRMNISEMGANGSLLQYDINVYNPDGSIQFSNTITFDPANPNNLSDLRGASTSNLSSLFSGDPDILQSLQGIDGGLRNDPAYINLANNKFILDSNEPRVLQGYREFIATNFQNLDQRQTQVQQYLTTPWFNNLLQRKVITQQQFDRMTKTYDYGQQVKILNYYQQRLQLKIQENSSQ